MRDAFSRTLVEIAKSDPNVILLTGDHGYALFDEFRRTCPNQYLNAGIAEQNMIGMAAGLSRLGFRPFVYGLSAFVPVRVLEQIKLDIAHDDLPVVLLGDGAGFVYSHLGTSHQSTEDIACTRAIPGLAVLSPADRFEMAASLRLAYAMKAPVYLRMGKSDRGDVHDRLIEPCELRQPLKVRNGADHKAVILATGSMVRTALEIQGQDIDCDVWSVSAIKPLPERALTDIARASDSLIVMEEHSILGGLGSAIAEVISEAAPKRLLRVGVKDRFSERCGTYADLLAEHGLDTESVRNRVSRFIGQSE
jgi:transketolase